jgi:hypothetical protein
MLQHIIMQLVNADETIMRFTYETRNVRRLNVAKEVRQ